jgi:hypothetical protein
MFVERLPAYRHNAQQSDRLLVSLGDAKPCNTLCGAINMKKGFLVVYDYETGGVWLFLLAESEEDIRRSFPELKIVVDKPRWLTAEREQRIRERMTIDIDDVDDSFLSALIRDRNAGPPTDHAE